MFTAGGGEMEPMTLEKEGSNVSCVQRHGRRGRGEIRYQMTEPIWMEVLRPKRIGEETRDESAEPRTTGHGGSDTALNVRGRDHGTRPSH